MPMIRRLLADHLQVRPGLLSGRDFSIDMSNHDWNGKDRRSGGDRRQAERREPQPQPDGSILSTRKGERRQVPRRKADRENPDPKKTNDEQ
ncbi:MAG TPA: hypothetical protein VJ464_07560 [Blastocatellia bacterium]|nr:hypothetical protein [Blastocatellia bacterium]